MGADITAMKAKVKTNIEVKERLKDFFLDEPGETISNWNDGSIFGSPSRYIIFSQIGSAFNYGWLNNYFIFSTNYEGIKEVVRRLGF